ncbi:MAG: cell division protein FtsZ, partial [Xanthobacteraceae bacterium]
PRPPQAVPPSAERLPGRPMPRAPESRAEPVSEYARRPALQPLDPHGRQMPTHDQDEQDQLEIPAFLRRQAH